MKCDVCKSEVENKISNMEQFRFDFIYKSYEDGVKNNAIIDTKTQLFVAYLGVTLVPLHDYYVKNPSVFDSILSFFGITLIFFIVSLFLFFKTIREPFDKFNYLGKESKYSYFFPRRYDDDKSVENILQEYKSSFKNANYDALLDAMILERLKFQHVYYLKIRLFRYSIFSTSLYTMGLIIMLFA